MKIKTTIIPRLTIAVALLSVVSFTASALAQNPPLYGPPRRTPTPATATATTAKSQTAGLSTKDKAFMKEAAKGGMMEVAMGKTAEQNGQSKDVKAFGKRMVTDHSKANTELMALAERKGVKLPAEKPSEKWSSDKDYIDMMVKDHEKDLAEFQNEARNGSDSDLKGFADRTAKVIQKHLDMAKKTQGKLQ
jgi:putative membrane protein